MKSTMFISGLVFASIEFVETHPVIKDIGCQQTELRKMQCVKERCWAD